MEEGSSRDRVDPFTFFSIGRSGFGQHFILGFRWEVGGGQRVTRRAISFPLLFFMH
jgi:hypothetical protein